LFTAVRETHFARPPEILWRKKWYGTNHLEYAVIVQYQSIKPMMGIGTKLRLMLVLSGAQCSASIFRKIGAIAELKKYAVHGIVVLGNEERGCDHLRRQGGWPRWSSVARSWEGVGRSQGVPPAN
jgi:hypothetical protein